MTLILTTRDHCARDLIEGDDDNAGRSNSEVIGSVSAPKDQSINIHQNLPDQLSSFVSSMDSSLPTCDTADLNIFLVLVQGYLFTFVNFGPN